MKLKHLIVLIVLAAFAAIIYGFTIKTTQTALAHKCIGFGTLSLFFIAMPLFLYKESKGKNMKDYMLTDENIKKMRNNEVKKPDNQ